MEHLHLFTSYFFNKECYDNYFIQYNFLNVKCFKILLSKCLGLTIITGSLLVKVPQIMKLLNNKSCQGINLMSVLLELTAITFHLSYCYVIGYPFSSWGDNAFLAFQTATIVILILYYGGSLIKSAFFILLYACFVFTLCSGLTPLRMLITTQSLNIPILLIGKLSQAWSNYRNSSTGQLSATTVFLLLAGSLARIFTSIQETGDLMIILTFCVSSFANGVIAAQILYYWSQKSDTRSNKKLL